MRSALPAQRAPQFSRSDRRRARVTHADTAGHVSEVGGFEVACAAQAGKGECGDDGVAGTGDVEDLALIGNGDVGWTSVGLEEAHAAGPKGEEEGFSPELRAQARASRFDPCLVPQPHSRGLLRFLEVRGRGGYAGIVEQPVAGVEADVATLRKTHNRSGDRLSNGALAVIREDKAVYVLRQA